MATAKLIQKAAKDYPTQGIKKGEPYWKWSFRFGGVHRSKTPPRPSQLTQSEFMSTMYGIQERIEDMSSEIVSLPDLASQMEEVVSDVEQLRDDTGEKLENMPENLQEGETGQMLQERIDAMETWAQELEALKDQCHEEGADVEALIDEIQATDPGV